MELRDNVFLITGGASGLGAATARQLAREGSRVSLMDIDADAGKKLAEELGDGSLFLPVDVTRHKEVDAAVKEVQESLGSIHGVVSCAGTGGSAKIVGKEGVVSPQWFTHIMNVNLVGTFYVIRATAPVLMANSPDPGGERGVYINTSSIAAQDGQVGQAAYAASKGGLVSMTLTLAREFAEQGIRIMTLLPGIFDTPLLGRLEEKVRERLGKQVPFPPRLGEPPEFASLVCEVIRNRYLNGECIRLDGGLRMGFGRK